MTHHQQTNGASLEDCHTNFFALTELCGIKWRKLVWGECGGGGGGSGGGGGGGGATDSPLEDPVVSSYARCLAGDILCVWRRVAAPPPPNADPYDMSAPPPPPPPPLSLRAAKELWIFWYGEEPDLSGLVAPELLSCQSEQGSWESGLSYECRSLLFKALHNLIERCLLSRDFVRLGKWFVQPYDGDEEDVGKSPWHLSFSFAFFVHGESTVCASVDVRQHPPVRTLTPQRLAAAAARRPTASAAASSPPPPPSSTTPAAAAPDADQQHSKVILAPFGLEGALTGASWGDSEPAAARLLDAWRQLYPLEPGCGCVEVLAGGVRLRYPTPYVLLTELEGGEARADAPPDHAHPLSAHRPPALAATMAERTVRALTTDRCPDQQAMDMCNGEVSSEKMDIDFVDPTRKTNCTCSKGGGACSPGSCGGGSPPAPASAPPSAGAPPASPSHLALPHHQLGGAGLHTPAPTPDPHAPPTPAPPSAPSARHYAQTSPPEVKAGGCGGAAGGAGEAAALLRLPVLVAEEKPPDPLDDEHTLHMLYDYTAVRAWLDHPVKRFKSEDSGFREDLTHPKGFGNNTDLYRGHDHTEMASVLHHPYSYNNPDIKQEPNDDMKDCKNLFTSDGLFPSIKDLDQIFDNSDDAASGDETLQIQTPPDSNKSGGEEARLSAGGGGGTRCVRAEELSKMFPTPPSMEAHTQASPGAFTLADDPSHTTHLATRLHAPSPSPDPIEDWSYVFKPPTVYKYVGSSKYAPLTALPSQLLPPVCLPPHATYRPRWQLEKEPPGVGGGGGGGGTKRPASPPPVTGNSAGTISAPASVGCLGDTGPASARGASPALRPPPPYSASPPSPASPRAPRPNACPLLLNVLLADTVLNIFRDHNFDSCTLCVCNASPKVVGNIRGADCNTYLTGGAPSPGESQPASPAQPYDDDPIRCSCGFSAVVNRRLAHRAGLFYEDEMEITGLAEETTPRGGSGGGGLSGVAELVLAQCSGLGGAASALARAAHAAASARPPDELRLNLLEYTDGGEAAALALRAAAGGAGGAACAVHRWPFIGARGPRSSRDVVRLMRRLRPMLQDAIQKRCCGARMWDGVTGPLTWRQFHRLAGRGTEDLCEPQPVPPLLVGHDRDWLSISPYALRHWERLALEPYAYARDVAYAVLAPEGEALAEPLRAFFRELSTVYESCRLGRHAPLWRIAKDGVIRASVTPDRDSTTRDDWVGEVPPGRLGECIRAYAETLRTVIVPQLANITLDRTLFEQDASTRCVSVERPAPSPMRPPSTPDHPPTPNSQSDQEGEGTGCGGGGGNGGGGGSGGGGGQGITGPSPAGWEEEEEGGAPALVLYVVEPPHAHAHASAALHALLRLAARAASHLHHHNITVKIISLESVCEVWGLGGGARAEMRALAFSVFTSARRLLSHVPHVKSLTGFGTAADAQLFLKNKDEKNRAPYRLYSPAFVLAPAKAIKDVAESFGQASAAEQCGVLYVSYCLSADQSWLLAVATDARGELLETTAINVHVPGRWRRRRAPQVRRHGLTKLMDFVLGVMSQSAQPWRLVVGRIGRIGHGELKSWSWLLSRKNLMKASGVLRDICGSCTVLYPPCILSACLVSTEPDSCLRLMADRFTPDERFSQVSVASHLHTPRDVTATHILVFPTSATTQSSQTAFQEAHINGTENDDILFPALPDNEEMPDGMDGIDNMNDILFSNELFNTIWPTGSPTGAADAGEGDGTGSREGSPGRGAPGRQASSPYGQNDDSGPASEQVGTVLQQPLALGYLVSTAPLGSMPSWWWAGCAHLRDACPAFLKNALHLHSSSDDMLLSAAQRVHDTSQHPLDSHITTDVLRYVLEGYNAMSWLALDSNTHDRLSCLPMHVQVLMQLYHTALALA